MRRLATPAVLVFVARGARTDAGEPKLPKAASLVERHKTNAFTHFVRADQNLPEPASLVGRHEANNLSHFVRMEE